MIETAKVQVASLDAGIAFSTDWVKRTPNFATVADKELFALTEENADANQVISRLVDSSRECLGRLAELPA
jgi:hypothetical protein